MNTLYIAYKEIRTYFASPIAYVVTVVFLVVSGYFFALSLRGSFPEASLASFFSPASFIFVLLGPILTMRLLAEEHKLGTAELLLTAPVRDFEVVLGKFLASLATLAFMLIPTIYYPFLLFWFSDPELGRILTGYLGFTLMSACFLSVGLFASSMTSNQIAAAVLAMGILLVLWFLDAAGRIVSGLGSDILVYSSVQTHLTDFFNGVIDTRDLVYFVTLTALFLFLTVRSLESRRWR